MEHVHGINWELIHELLIAEYRRVQADMSEGPTAKQEKLAELSRNNDIAVKNAEKQM
jgi:hypothetical protein